MSQNSPLAAGGASARSLKMDWKNQTGFEFRLLRAADILRVHQIESQVYQDPWSLELLFESLKAPLTYSLGAFLNGVPIAYAIYQIIFDEGHLLNLAVDPKLQSQGLGRLVLSEVIQRAQHAEAKILYLEVRPSNSVARSLYELAGFSSHSLRDKYYPNGESALIMSLDI